MGKDVIYKFNQSVINSSHFSLTINGELKSVEPKVFDLILYLINHRDEVVTRQQLFDDLWDARLVSDATLSNHIKMARAVLEDDGEKQSVIKTVRSRGYQFIARVEDVTAATEAEPAIDGTKDETVNGDSAVTSVIPNTVLKIGALVVASIIAILLWQFSTEPDNSLGTSTDVDTRPYILVVPFAVSGDNKVGWQPFADQITREVIRDLRKISGLRVIPSSSAFTFKENKTVSYIRQQLPQVRYVLNAIISIGAESEIRITAELDDIETGKLIWDGDYQNRIDDSNFFEVQTKIAASVSDSLKIVILDEERQILDQVPTINLAAYELYVQGQHQLEILTQKSLYRAVDLFSKAIELDPNFEEAYIAKADSYRLLMSYFEKPIDILPRVTGSVVGALKINPDSAEARSSLGLAYVFAWRWEDAWKMLNESREHNPNLALTELGFAIYYSAMGDKDGVHRSLQRATKLDPLNVEIADWGHWALVMVGETEDAIKWGEKQIRLHPKVGMIYSGASVSAAIAGDYEKAITLAKKGVLLDTGSSFSLLSLAQAYGFAGEIEKIHPLLQQVDEFSGYTCPYESAIVYAQLGQLDRAFELLNEAIEYRSNCLVFILNDPRMKLLRNDLRFTSILTRVGLDEEAIKNHPR